MTCLRDPLSRVIDYLRISVTDRCNLRCIYCMPAEGVVPVQSREILAYEEITRIARVAAGLGVRKVRLTGGEPLTRRNIVFLVQSLKAVSGIEDLSLTTNGVHLEQYAGELATVGLDRVNVSIDSFRPDRYREITRGGDLGLVMRGLDAARKAGLTPVKINMVPMRGVNEDEIEDFARMTLESDCHVRFIEFMPVGQIDSWSRDRYVGTDEIWSRLNAIAPLVPVRVRKSGPSKYFRFEGGRGVVGFISALTHHFCRDCNRLRLTADGKLRPCLFSETEIDLKAPLRSGSGDGEIERLLRLAIAVKPEGHRIGQRDLRGVKEQEALRVRAAGFVSPAKRPMSKIGG